MGASVDATDSLIGVLMVELPPDWWLPEGYSLQSNGPQVVLPLEVTDPLGQNRQIYATAGFRPSQARVDSIAEVIEEELGPLQAGFSPETKHQLGMDRPDLLGFINSTIMMPVEAVVAVFDLANYGISATIVAGTQGMAQAGWMNQSDARRLRRDLNLLAIVAAAETGRGPARLPTRVKTSALRVAAIARAKAAVAAPALLVRIVRTAPHCPAALLRSLTTSSRQQRSLRPEPAASEPGWRACVLDERSTRSEADFTHSTRSML
jgi:hypothetical protein